MDVVIGTLLGCLLGHVASKWLAPRLPRLPRRHKVIKIDKLRSMPCAYTFETRQQMRVWKFHTREGIVRTMGWKVVQCIRIYGPGKNDVAVIPLDGVEGWDE